MTNDLVGLNEWNEQCVSLMQAMIGSISSNFRMVTLGRDQGHWSIKIFLERENEEDREEIFDIGVQFDALQKGFVERSIEVIVTESSLSVPAWPIRTMFRRRENSAVAAIKNGTDFRVT